MSILVSKPTRSAEEARPSSSGENGAQLVERARRLILDSRDPGGSSRDNGSERALRFGGTWAKLQHGVSLRSSRAMQ